jgi:uncharacterized protein YbcI
MNIEDELTGRDLGEVTNRIIQVFAENTGKGPERGKSFVNDDLLVTVLGGALTDLEETLLAQGRPELVRHIRIELEHEMREALMRTVAEATGRRVLDYSSQLLVEARVLIELFVLDAPESGRVA